MKLYILYVLITFIIILMIESYIKRSIEFYTSKHTIEIVVAAYEEDLSWLLDIPEDYYTKITIYNKGSRKSFGSEKIRVIDVDNYGRDGYCYIYHVVHNYNSLADITFFVQGSTQTNPGKLHQYNKIIKHIQDNNTSIIHCGPHKLDDIMGFYLNSWENTNTNNRTGNPDKELTQSAIRPLGAWFNKHFPGETIHCISYLGILAASREDIRKRPIKLYKTLLDELSIKNPEVAHYTERVWANIFSIDPQHCIITEGF